MADVWRLLAKQVCVGSWGSAFTSLGLPSLAALTADVACLCNPAPASHIGRSGTTPALRVRS